MISDLPISEKPSRPALVWVAITIILLYATFFLAIVAYQTFRQFTQELEPDDWVFSFIRLATALPFGLTILFTILGVAKRKRWSRWLYLHPILMLPLILVFDTIFGVFYEDFEGVEGNVLLITIMVLFYVPLVLGCLILIFGKKANAYFDDTTADELSDHLEPPPPPTFENQ